MDFKISPKLFSPTVTLDDEKETLIYEKKRNRITPF